MADVAWRAKTVLQTEESVSRLSAPDLGTAALAAASQLVTSRVMEAFIFLLVLGSNSTLSVADFGILNVVLRYQQWAQVLEDKLP